MEGSVYPQAEHTARWAHGLGRGESHIPQSERAAAVDFAALCDRGTRQVKLAYDGSLQYFWNITGSWNITSLMV